MNQDRPNNIRTNSIDNFIDNKIFFDNNNNIGTNVTEIFYNEKKHQKQNNNGKNKNEDDDKKYLFYNILKNVFIQLNSGVNIHEISLPIFICEPRSFLEKITDLMGYPQYLLRVPYLENPLQRFVGIIKYVLSCWSLSPKTAKKPFNPVLGEYFRARWKLQDNTYGYYVGEQTSINPPISSYYFCNPANGIVIHGETKPKTKLSGINLKTIIYGGNKIIFHKHHKYYNNKKEKGNMNNKLIGVDEEYYISTPNINVKNKWFKSLSMDYCENFFIWCPNTQYVAIINFLDKNLSNNSFFGNIYKEEKITLNDVSNCKRNTNNNVKDIILNFIKENKFSTSYEIFGSLNDTVYIKKTKNELNIKSSIMNIKEESVSSMYATPPLMQDQLESRKIWYTVTKGMLSYSNHYDNSILNKYPNYSSNDTNKNENNENNINNNNNSSSSSNSNINDREIFVNNNIYVDNNVTGNNNIILKNRNSVSVSSSSSSSSSLHHEMVTKLAIEKNQENINQYISEFFQKKFISYLFQNSEALSHIINDKDLKYINFLSIEEVLDDHQISINGKCNKNRKERLSSSFISNNNNAINYMVNKVKRKNSISVLEMNNNKINKLLNSLSSNHDDIKDKKYYTKKEFFNKEFFWWTPKYFQPYECNIKKRAFDEMMTELIKNKNESYVTNNCKNSSQSKERNEIEMDMNVYYFKNILKANNYEIPDNINMFIANEQRNNIFSLKHICPLVYLLDYKNPNNVEKIILSYIWPKKLNNYQTIGSNINHEMNNTREILTQWINFNNCIHQYFWFNDIVKHL